MIHGIGTVTAGPPRRSLGNGVPPAGNLRDLIAPFLAGDVTGRDVESALDAVETMRS